MTTNEELTGQVSVTLGDHVEDFDVAAIVQDIREEYGPAPSVDDVPAEDYSAILERHDLSIRRA